MDISYLILLKSFTLSHILDPYYSYLFESKGADYRLQPGEWRSRRGCLEQVCRRLFTPWLVMEVIVRSAVRDLQGPLEIPINGVRRSKKYYCVEAASSRPLRTALAILAWSRSVWAEYSIAKSPTASSKVVLFPMYPAISAGSADRE